MKHLCLLLTSIALTSSLQAQTITVEEDKAQVEKQLRNILHKAERGDTAAMAAAAYIYGLGYAPGRYWRPENWLYDEGKCRYWYARGMDAGSANCAYRLGERFDGSMRPKNENKDSAIFFFKKAAALGSVDAMKDLGTMYCYAPHNEPQEARYWYGQAAAHGSEFAAGQLRNMKLASSHTYEDGLAAYNSGRYAEAIEFFEAAAGNNYDTRALEKLGDMYTQGQGTPVNLQRAYIRYFTCSAMHSGACSYKLGEWYYANERSPNWRLMARHAWDSASAQGYLPAAARIAQYDAEVADVARKDDAAEALRQSRQITKADLGPTPSAGEIEAYKKQQAANAANRPLPKYEQPVLNWSTPSQTGAQRDQEMYDKMHKEADQREKNYNDKWGR